MIYYILRFYSRFFFRIYFKLGHTDLKNIPYKKALVIAPNHVNGFVDPVYIADTIRNKVRFFARGDVFKGKFLKWLLNEMNMSPMYRLREGYGNIKKNNAIFEECEERLKNNETLLIFPEAVCVPEKRLQPLKKGLSRIVFQTEEALAFKKHLLIIPVGLNYTNGKKFRSELFMNFGETISLKDYEELYQENKVKAINKFTRSLEATMREQIITIKNKDNDELVETLHEIYLPDWMKLKGRNTKSIEDKYYARKEFVEALNGIDDSDPNKLSHLRNITPPYLKSLERNKLRDHLIKSDIEGKSGFLKFIGELTVLILGIPFYFVGLITNWPPFYLAFSIANKKVKEDEFYASTAILISMCGWLAYFIFQLVIIAFIFKNFSIVVTYTLSMILLGRFALVYYPRVLKILGRWRLIGLKRSNRKLVAELVNKRIEIVEQIENLIKLHN